MTNSGKTDHAPFAKRQQSKDYDIPRIRELALGAIRHSVLIADAEREGAPVVFANAAFTVLTGYAAEEVIGRNCGFLAGPDTDQAVRTEMREAIAAERPFSGLLLNYRKDGSAFWNEVSIELLQDEGHGRFWMGTQTDVTERRELEMRLRESQRMEALGKLSGGIAHDFNNILALILGNAEIISGEASRGSLTRDAAADIIEAAQGGSDLVTRMLQYARGENGISSEVQLNAAIEDVVALLARTMSHRVDVQTDLSAAIGHVRLDRTLFETALMNLVLNARDALDGSGTIRIMTRRRGNAGPLLGTVAVVSVSDSGVGMDEATAARAFEPFFTTKAAGLGNGLGLAMVYNFVKQSGGDLSIDSAPGRGTTVTMLLPIDEPAVRSIDASDESRRILLVEDDAKLRKVLVLHLERAGYSIVEAAGAEEAVALIDGGLYPAMLVSDIRLREGMTGVGLIKLLAERGHAFPMLLMTGFAEELDAGSNLIDGVTVLRKPFRTDELLAEVERRVGVGRAQGTRSGTVARRGCAPSIP